jgi:hypothetical protein
MVLCELRAQPAGYRIEHTFASVKTNGIPIRCYRQGSPLDILHFWRFLCKQVCKQQACRAISFYKFGGYDFIASDSLSNAMLFYSPITVSVDSDAQKVKHTKGLLYARNIETKICFCQLELYKTILAKGFATTAVANRKLLNYHLTKWGRFRWPGPGLHS